MKELTDERIVEEAKAAGKKIGFCELVSKAKGVNSAYGIGFIEGMVKYRELMTQDHELKENRLKELADQMYQTAMYLSTDASRLRKAMEEYHRFIIYEYGK